jgi:uncharacterized protein (DUF885 family)
MNRLVQLLTFFLLLLTACNNNPDKPAGMTGSADDAFQKLSDEFLTGYLSWRPQLAVGLGFHEYNGKVTDYSKTSLDAELTRLKDFEQRLNAVDTAGLSPKMFYDFRILRSAILYEIYNFEDFKYYTHNPMNYANAVDVNLYIKRDFAPLEERLRYVIAVEQKIPEVYAAAKANLEDSLPKPYIETAISIAEGGAGFLKGDLLVALKDVKNDSLMKAFTAINNKAIAAVGDFVSWLKKEKLPRANNAYAIGKDNYKKMLLYSEDIRMSPEEILEIGLKELEREKDRFNKAAAIINPNKKPRDVLNDVQKEHPSAENLIPEAKRNLELIRQFVIDKNICTMPSEVRVQVKETPQYARATSTASMDVAGPFETKATESYYYITPVDPTWTSKQKEDWLSSFDYYTTDNVTVHEAYPGHYTQFLHLNASSASKIEKIFGSYAYIEGWAHYCEKMMIDEGFGNDGDSIKAAKYRMAQSGDALLRLCRLCVSIKMHCQGMTVAEGTKFFMDNWYQGEKPSAQEALRGSFDPGYLFYTLGKLQIIKLRDDYHKQEGNNFTLKSFHDQLMDNGMPPIRLLREVLLKDQNSWDATL